MVVLKHVLQNGVQALQAEGELEPAGLSVPPGHGLQVLLPNPAQVPAGHSAKTRSNHSSKHRSAYGGKSQKTMCSPLGTG